VVLGKLRDFNEIFIVNCGAHLLNTKKYYIFTGGEINGLRGDRIHYVDRSVSITGSQAWSQWSRWKA